MNEDRASVLAGLALKVGRMLDDLGIPESRVVRLAPRPYGVKAEFLVGMSGRFVLCKARVGRQWAEAHIRDHLKAVCAAPVQHAVGV